MEDHEVSIPRDAQPHWRAGCLEALVGQLERLGRKEEKDQLKAKKPTKPLRFFVGQVKGCLGGEEEKKELGREKK